MSANINDKVTAVRDTVNPTVTTVASARSIGGTSLSCVDLSGWPTDTAVHFITYQKTAAGAIDKTTQCDWKGIVSGTTIGTLTLKNGTDAGNSAGDFVEMAPTAAWAQDLHDGVTQDHDVNGYHTQLTDTNGKKIIGLTATASAVNQVTVVNAATGNAPQIQATGTDSDIDVEIVPKGAGKVKKVVEALYNPYKISVYRNAAWTASGTLTAVVFDTSTGTGAFDTGSNYSTSTGKFTAPQDGYYFFNSTVGVGTVAASHGCQIALYVNGALAKWGFQGSNGTTQAMHISVSGLLKLTAGDYVQVYVGGDGNSGATGAVNTFFDALLLYAG